MPVIRKDGAEVRHLQLTGDQPRGRAVLPTAHADDVVFGHGGSMRAGAALAGVALSLNEGGAGGSAAGDMLRRSLHKESELWGGEESWWG